MGAFTILQKYSCWVYRVMVRPLEFVERIQRAKCESTPKLTTANPMFSNEHKERLAKQQQQDISRLDSILTDIGLKYDPDALFKIWRLSGKCMNNIASAVEMLLHRHSTQTEAIGNPNGWLINCLTKGLYKTFDLYYQAELPVFNNAADLGGFVKGIVNNVTARGDTDSFGSLSHN